MRTFVSMLALSAALTLQPAWAQTAEEMQAQMNASMGAARQAAQHPGDENLTCDQLSAELQTIAQDPVYQAQMAEMGATAQNQVDQMQNARSRAQGQAAGAMVTGVITSFIPGAGYAQMLAQRAQAQQMQREAQANQAQMAGMMGNMQASMPFIMRQQRLFELGQAKQCAFTQQPMAGQQGVTPSDATQSGVPAVQQPGSQR
jgi:hypothetical protein